MSRTNNAKRYRIYWFCIKSACPHKANFRFDNEMDKNDMKMTISRPHRTA